jgi:uncharacterized protein YraI
MNDQNARRGLTIIGIVLLVLTGLVAALPVSAGGGVVVVTTDNVNLRSLPGSAGDVLDVIPYGTELEAEAISANGLWIYVTYDDQPGWINLNYVSVEEGALSDLSVDEDLEDEEIDAVVTGDDSDEDEESDIESLFDLWESLYGNDSSSSSSTTSSGSSRLQRKMIITWPTSGLDLPADQVTVTWLAVRNADSYRIEVYSDQAAVVYTVTYRTSGTSLSVPTSGMPSRAEGWGYWIAVSALDEDGDVIAQDRVWGRRVDSSASSSRGGFPPRR